MKPCTTFLTLLAIVPLADCAGPRPRTLPSGNQQINYPAMRDRLRRELPGVIEVVRLPAGSDSTWVARVRRDAPDTTGIVRFNTAAPHFLTWMLNNTRADHKALLASLPATARAPAILYDSLVADSLFLRTVTLEVGLFRGTSRTIGGRAEFLFDDLMTFATRYFRLDADSAQRFVFSLCEKSEFRGHIKEQLDRNITARLFSYRMTPGRPWADALIATCPGTVTKVPDAVRTRFDLDTTFYGKYADAGTVNTLEEYWAEGTQFWFWNNTPKVFVAAGVEHTVWSPDDLQRYDPKLYSILSRVYADHRIPADVFHGWKWR